jgi:UDP-N-acetylglucosamine 3-dehydrogenase
VTRPPLRVAVIGLGLIGRQHARVASESDETELTAVVDADRVTERITRERRVASYRTVDELLEGRHVDAAVVSVPTGDHPAVVGRLLEAGVPVLVEKPIAETVEEAATLVVAAARSGVHLAVGHVERFNPAVRELQARLAEGELGRLFQVEARRLSPYPARVPRTGVATDLATHDLDVMCCLAGAPIRISAEVERKAGRPREDLLAALLRFDSGIVGVLQVNWLTPTKVRRLSVTGEQGMFVVDYLEQQLTRSVHTRSAEEWEEREIFGGPEGDVLRHTIRREEPLRAQLDAFVRAVRGEEPVTVTGEDGIRIIALAQAALEAAAAGRTIELDPAAA